MSLILGLLIFLFGLAAITWGRGFTVPIGFVLILSGIVVFVTDLPGRVGDWIEKRKDGF